ncbi:hypothetical protein SAMN02745202_00416 [Segatella oulorum]|uniref:Type IX secretion system protein PorV domain-containing protein n=2 Tax=Segatella oulorum TaxID=28136 RepID=A0A1T4LFH5_9BACT|nr:hypothetical protein SAMN02745202_00416 [Segatella oulorum]
MLVALMLAGFSPQIAAQSIKETIFNPVYTAVTSQTIAPDARAAGMGDVGVATDPDVNAQYWNPAKYPFNISRAGVSLNYTPWLRRLVNDMYLANLTGFYRIGNYSAVSTSLRYFNMGEVELPHSGSTGAIPIIHPHEMSFDVGYALMLSERFSIAAAVRYIHSDLTYDYSDATQPGSAFAADLALYYQNYVTMGQRECQLGLGMNISNIGSKINFSSDDNSEFIPTNLRLGGALMVPIDEYNRFSVAVDANKLLVPTRPIQRDNELPADFDKRLQRDYYDVSSINGIFKSFSDAPGGLKEELQEVAWSLGGEYVYHDQFAVRAGYHHESANKGNRKYLTLGAGFKTHGIALDAAYLIATAKSNPLDQTLRLSLAFDFDGIKDLFRR